MPVATANDHEHFSHLIHGLAKAWRQALDRRLKPMGISRAKWHALFLLSRHGGGLLQRELADLMEIGEPAMVSLADRLQQDGLIERKLLVNDRRARRLEMTAAGKKLMAKIEAAARKLRKEVLASHSATQLTAVSNTLKKMKSTIESLP